MPAAITTIAVVLFILVAVWLIVHCLSVGMPLVRERYDPSLGLRYDVRVRRLLRPTLLVATYESESDAWLHFDVLIREFE